MNEPELIRPVRCYFCNRPMYYAGDPRQTPEVLVDFVEVNTRRSTEFYAHVPCWNTALEYAQATRGTDAQPKP